MVERSALSSVDIVSNPVFLLIGGILQRVKMDYTLVVVGIMSVIRRTGSVRGQNTSMRWENELLLLYLCNEWSDIYVTAPQVGVVAPLLWPSSKFHSSAMNGPVSQVGPLCSFSQDDLEQHISCILDPGCDVVFVWHGSRASTKMRVR